MKEIFKSLIEIEDIQAVLYYSDEGNLLFRKISGSLKDEIKFIDAVKIIESAPDWNSISGIFRNINESEFVYENRRIFIKKAPEGYIVVVLGLFVPISIIRLNCEIIIPKLTKVKKSKGIGRFFRKR